MSESAMPGSRADHLAWCRERAMDCIAAGQPGQAATSMTSDLLKHPGTNALAAVFGQEAMFMLLTKNSDGLARLIREFPGE